MTNDPVATHDPRTSRHLTLAVIGSGVVGAATGRGFLAVGHDVVFCDVAPERVLALRAEGLEALEPSSLHEAHADVYLISVPSPTVRGRVDLTYVEAAAASIGRAIRDHSGRPLVVVRSTVPPGTTHDVVAPAVARESGRAAGDGFGLCMNPEFLREASAYDDFMSPRVIVVGADDAAAEAALRHVYAPWPDVPVAAMPVRAAEVAKYTSNLFNAAKISFFNEMEQVCQALDVDARAVFDAVALGAEGLWNPAYGTRGLYPFGGACLPKDTEGFLGFVEDGGVDVPMLMLRAALEINERLAADQAPVDLALWREDDDLPRVEAL